MSANFTLEADYDEAQGRRDTMEDAHCVISDAKSREEFGISDVTNKVALYGVFDGHGGVDAAIMVEKHLPKAIFSDVNFKQGDYIKALTCGFEETDKLIVTTSNQAGWMNGSTAVAALLIDTHLYVANIGDSEAVLVKVRDDGSTEPDPLTTLHKASDPGEKKRIEALGGHVFFGRVFGALAVSRSFGDSKFKMPKTSQNFVSWEPAIRSTDVTPAHKFLILACDGLWDVMTHQEAADFAQKQKAQGKSAKETAQALVRESLAKKTEDNVTCIVIYFNWDASATVAAASSNDMSVDSPADPKPAEATEPAPSSGDGFGAFSPISSENNS